MTSEEKQEILTELRRIASYLALLVEDKIKEKRSAFEAKVTIKRRQMWNLMDGTKNISHIAEKVNVSQEAVRIFVIELEKEGLVEVQVEGRGRYPRRIIL